MPFSLVGDDVIGEDFFWTNLPWGRVSGGAGLKVSVPFLLAPRSKNTSEGPKRLLNSA